MVECDQGYGCFGAWFLDAGSVADSWQGSVRMFMTWGVVVSRKELTSEGGFDSGNLYDEAFFQGIDREAGQNERS